MFSALHQRCHRISGFPGSDGHHAVADGRTDPADESRNSEHLHRDLSAAFVNLPLFFNRAGFKPRDAECSGRGGFPCDARTLVPKLKGPIALG
jgi:hypothetical protein